MAQARTATGKFTAKKARARASHVLLIVCDDRTDGFKLLEPHFQNALQNGVGVTNVKVLGYWPEREASMMLRSAMLDLTAVPETE